MTSRRSHDEIQELLGAFALDAVDADEALHVEDHLRDCARCRAEVAAHRETAAMLVDSFVEPPAALWERVTASLEDAAPPPLDLARYTPRAARRRPPALRLVAVAAALAGVLGLGTVTLQQQGRVDNLRAELDHQELAVAALAAFDEPEARHATLRAADGSAEIRAVVLRDGSGYLLAERLQPLTNGRVYQLWGMVGGDPVPAGVLGADPGVATFRVPRETAALAISVERAGGAETPTLPVRLTGLVEA
jgi:anti-sigma-K factor RskA